MHNKLRRMPYNLKYSNKKKQNQVKFNNYVLNYLVFEKILALNSQKEAYSLVI